jgi:hypothetical protein
MGGRTLHRPVVGITSTPDGKGYWEVAADGGIFSFGDASFHGTIGQRSVNGLAGIAASFARPSDSGD